MANQIIVTDSGNVQVSITPTNNVQVEISRAAITTLTSVGNANYANVAGTVANSSQPNITSVGTLVNLTSAGNITAPFFIGNVVGGGAGTPTISSTTNLDLSAVSAVRVIGGGTFRLPSLTTAQIANTIAANGDMIYNSSVNKFQGYENGAWANII
jgi:hypothetical protein